MGLSLYTPIHTRTHTPRGLTEIAPKHHLYDVPHNRVLEIYAQNRQSVSCPSRLLLRCRST